MLKPYPVLTIAGGAFVLHATLGYYVAEPPNAPPLASIVTTTANTASVTPAGQIVTINAITDEGLAGPADARVLPNRGRLAD